MTAFWEIAAHSAYDMLYKYMVFSNLGFWSGNFILIATFPDRCPLVPLYILFTGTKEKDLKHMIQK